MADSTEKVTYKFEVKSKDAVKNARALDASLAGIEATALKTLAPLKNLSQSFYQVATTSSKLNMSAKSVESLKKQLQSACDPAKELVRQFRQAAREQTKVAKTAKTIGDIQKEQAQRNTKANTDKQKLQEAYQAVANAGHFSLTTANKAKIDSLISGSKNPLVALKNLARDLAKEQQKIYGKITLSERMERAFAEAAKDATERTKEHKAAMTELLKEQQRNVEAERKKTLEFQKQHQNDNNAPIAGVIHTDSPLRPAFDSAQTFLDLETKSQKFKRYFNIFKDTLPSIVSSFSAIASQVSMIVTSAKALVKLFAFRLKKAVHDLIRPISVITKSLSAVGNLLFKKHNSSFGLSKLFRLGAGVGFGKLLAGATKNATELAESMNMFTQVLHENNEEGNKFVNFLSEMSGLDATKLRDTTSMFYEMFIATVDNARDEAGKAAMKISKDLTVMSIDIASLFNKEADEVAENLISGMRGMSRSVVKYGMDLRNSTVEAYAKSKLGITENFRTMNEANREVLRYLVMLHQANDAQSDFAKTIESPANQLKIFKNQVLGVSREIGRFIVNVLAPALPVINGFAMALRLMLKAIADFLGVWNGLTTQSEHGSESFEDASAGLDGLGASAGGAAKKIKQLLAPFDELNILAEQSANAGAGSGSGGYGIVDPKLLALLDDTESKFTKIQMAAHDARDRILEFFGLDYVFDPLKGILDYIEVIPGEFADNLIRAFQLGSFETVGALIAGKLSEITRIIADKLSWDNLGPKITSKLKKLFAALNTFIEKYDWKSFGKVFGNAVKTALETIDFIGLNFNWTALGKAIATSLSSFITSSSVSKIGSILATWLNGVVSFAASLTYEFDWRSFGNSIVTTINDFFATWDINALAVTASSIIKHLLNSLTRIIKDTDWTSIGQEIGQALQTIDWDTICDQISYLVWEIFKAKWKLRLGELVGYTTPTRGEKSSSNFTRGDSRRGSFGGSFGGTVFPNAGKYKEQHFASGGIVTGPTRALIGEAGRSEAVIPLDNSPQMNDLVQQIADRVDSQSVVSAIYTLIDAVNSKDLSVNIGDDAIGSSYDRYNIARGARVTQGAFANLY